MSIYNEVRKNYVALLKIYQNLWSLQYSSRSFFLKTLVTLVVKDPIVHSTHWLYLLPLYVAWKWSKERPKRVAIVRYQYPILLLGSWRNKLFVVLWVTVCNICFKVKGFIFLTRRIYVLRKIITIIGLHNSIKSEVIALNNTRILKLWAAGLWHRDLQVCFFDPED